MLLTGRVAASGDMQRGDEHVTHYRSNLRDLEFNLFEVFGRDQDFACPPFAEVDAATARDSARGGQVGA